jgi:hypothetical protein
MLGERKATTKLRMGVTEVGAGVAVASLLADTRVIQQDASAFGLVFGIIGRHRSTS